MNIWNQEKYIKAWNFASHAHRNQYLPASDIPYINHVGNVAMEAMTAIVKTKSIELPDLFIQCSLLHDTIEDTNITYDNIKLMFGCNVADGVAALSKNKYLPDKTEQMEDCLNRISEQPVEVWMVKLADRITNLQPPPKHWDKKKIENYRNEALIILETLSASNEFLSRRLKNKIANYAQYLQ